LISKEEMIKLLCKSYSGLRDRIVLDVDSWMTDDGDISYFGMVGSLSSLVVENILDDNYDDADALFHIVDVLLKEGDDNVQNIMATGFLESLQNQTKLEGKYWSPLLGLKAVEFCRSMDEFHGIKTDGLH